MTDKEHEADDQQAGERQKDRERRFGEDRITGATVAMAVSTVSVAIAARSGEDGIRRNEEANCQNCHDDEESYTLH